MLIQDDFVHDLLSETLQRFVAADAHIAEVRSDALRRGMSGSAVARHAVAYTTSRGEATTSLITKEAERREWLVLKHLQSQKQPNIPFAHAGDDGEHNRVLICMQDVGDQQRPTVLEPIRQTVLDREIAGLAAIHAANFSEHRELTWLPSMDLEYVKDMIFGRAWRPAWERATANTRFASAFHDSIPRVEAAAATIVDDMRALLNDETAQTLIHADINPSNVLLMDENPYVIDWQTAMRGPFYIDLPHHLFTRELAEKYRQSLADRGHEVSQRDFSERYRVAARYIGLRYMWWTLEGWLEHQVETAWVQHYIGLVTGDGIDR